MCIYSFIAYSPDLILITFISNALNFIKHICSNIPRIPGRTRDNMNNYRPPIRKGPQNTCWTFVFGYTQSLNCLRRPCPPLARDFADCRTLFNYRELVDVGQVYGGFRGSDRTRSFQSVTWLNPPWVCGD